MFFNEHLVVDRLKGHAGGEAASSLNIAALADALPSVMVERKFKKLNTSGECHTLATRVKPLWTELHSALLITAQPAVIMSTSCAQYPLLQNFLCGLEQRPGLAHTLHHVLVVALDTCVAARLARDWPRVQQLNGSGVLKPVGSAMAAAGTPDFGHFAVFKAWALYAAAAMGFSAIGQDVDVAWSGDVIGYLHDVARRTGGELFVPVDNPLLDAKRYPCGRLFWERGSKSGKCLPRAGWCGREVHEGLARCAVAPLISL